MDFTAVATNLHGRLYDLALRTIESEGATTILTSMVDPTMKGELCPFTGLRKREVVLAINIRFQHSVPT